MLSSRLMHQAVAGGMVHVMYTTSAFIFFFFSQRNYTSEDKRPQGSEAALALVVFHLLFPKCNWLLTSSSESRIWQTQRWSQVKMSQLPFLFSCCSHWCQVLIWWTWNSRGVRTNRLDLVEGIYHTSLRTSSRDTDRIKHLVHRKLVSKGLLTKRPGWGYGAVWPNQLF